MRVALFSHNAQAGDAIGNQIAEKVTFFLYYGADVQVFLESGNGAPLHPAVQKYVQILSRPEPTGEAVLPPPTSSWSSMAR